MFKVNPGTKIFLCSKPVHMSRSFAGLSRHARAARRHEPRENELFVFFNEKLNYIKVLYFEDDAACIWAKRLYGVAQFEVHKTGVIPEKEFDRFVKSHVIEELKKAA